MAKKPVLRPSYKSDAKYLRRLMHAIERDEAKPKWWRDSTIIQISILINQFEVADGLGEETPSPTEEVKTDI